MLSVNPIVKYAKISAGAYQSILTYFFMYINTVLEHNHNETFYAHLLTQDKYVYKPIISGADIQVALIVAYEVLKLSTSWVMR